MLGISLAIIGLVFLILVFVVLRFLPAVDSSREKSFNAFNVKPSSSQEAVILIEPGGRVEYISPAARAFFDIREYEPYDLERLARRVRPSQDFLDLCASPGQKRVSIAGKLVEITSLEVPGEFPLMLLSLRGKELIPVLEDGNNGASAELLHVVTDFSKAIAANLDLNTTVHSILDNINRLVPADVLELKLWNEEEKKLTPHRSLQPGVGVPASSASQFGSLTNRLIEQRAPILIEKVSARDDLADTGELIAIQSYLGIPLMVGGQMIGALEAGQMGGNVFGKHDLDLLQLVAGQAAVAVRNALLYEQEQKRGTELAGLANLNRMLGTVRDMDSLFTRLVENIAPLFMVDIVGFIIYDEEKRILQGKAPFHGFPSHLVALYRASVPQNSAAEEIINSQKPIFTINASTDEMWRALGFSDIALAASLRDNALIPLISSGRVLGYMQVGHHHQGAAPFSNDEVRLMDIIASQAAALIENVMLMHQTRSRAMRADTLRRIAILANSSATMEEVLKFSVQALSNLFQADMGAVFLMDESRGEIRLHRESTFGVPEDIPANLIKIFLDDPNYRYTVSGSQKSFISGKLSSDRRVLPAYRPIASTLHVESAIVVPLIAREHSIGELMLGSLKENYFTNYDVQIVLTAAGQIATVIEAANLAAQTDASLRRRVEQLNIINHIGRLMGASLDIDGLLHVMHDEFKRAIRADCVSIAVFDEKITSELVIKYSIGCKARKEITPLEETVLASGEAQRIDDYSQEGIFPPHDGVRSAIIAPVLHQGKKAGLINLHSNHPGFFNAETVEIVKALTLQAGVALSNARRYQSEKLNAEFVRRRAETLSRLTEVSYKIDHEQPIEQTLQLIAQGLREATPFRVVLISVLEAETGLLRRVAAVGIPQETLNELFSRKQPLNSLLQIMKPEFKISRSFFIPADQFPVIPSDVHIVTLDVAGPSPVKSAEIWNPEDALLVPLENAKGEIIGIISLDDPEDGLRPDRATLESIEVFASQASLFISNTLLRNELTQRIDSLTAGLQRQQKLLSITQNDLPILLRKDLEQTISLHNLDRRAQRVRAGLAITESVSRQLDASSALSALGRETLTQLEMSVALIAENTPEGPRLMHSLGALPRATNVESLFGQRNPLRACLQNGKPILIANLDENEEWRDASLLTSLRAKAVICLPVMVEDKIIAAMLAVNPEPVPDFNEEDRQVYLQIAQQTSIILQNISLLNQTRRRLEEVNLLLDFSRRLSGLDADELVTSLLESARSVLHNAHAGVALLWNPQTDTLTPRAISGYADNASMSGIQYHIGEALPGMVFHTRVPRRVDEINFARDYNLSPEYLALYRQATGGRLPVSSLLIPIVASEQALGVLVLDNFNSTAAFRADDEALLVSLAQQVALSLDNLRLVKATQERAGLLQSLNDASSSITSSLNREDLVSSLLDLLGLIIPYDTATLWMRDKDRLSVVSTRGFSDTDQRLGLSVSVSDSALFKEMAQTGQPILVHDVREDHRFPPVESPRLSWLGMPLISKGELVGVIAIEKSSAHFYSQEQMQVGLAFASQTAISLDNAQLFEESVSRTAELTVRSQRLSALNRFASTLTGLLDTDQILSQTAAEILEGLGAHRVSIVTFERGRAYWKVSAPRARIALPRILPPAPIFNRLRESLGIFNTNDPLHEPDIAPLLEEFLGESNASLLVLPLVTGGTLFALVFVQQAENGPHFGSNELDVARTLTSQAATALENTRLYEATARTAQRFAILNESSSQISSSLDPEQIYAAVYQAAQKLMPLDSFIITLLDEDTNEIDPVYLLDRGKRFTGERVPFGRGLSSEIISNRKPMLVSQAEQLEEIDSVTVGEEGEETQSIVAVPMMVGNRALGMLSVQSYQKGVYTQEDVQVLGTLANQAIVAIQNGRLFAQTQSLAEQLEARVSERTAQLQREQQNTETLLHILTEVSSSLDLDRALNRTLSLLNNAIGAEQGTIMLLHQEDNLLHYRAGYGYLSNQIESSRGFTLKVGEGLAGWVVQNREAVLVNDLHKDPRWVRSSSSQQHRSAIIVPMLVADDAIGVLMVFHRELNFFSAEMLNLVKAIASQVAVAINNAHLYELIRDQAEKLGVMLRKQQEEASRSKAILQAVADGVLVTAPDNTITFLNASAEKVLGIRSSRLLDSPLEALGDSLSHAGTTWMETIRRWAEDPSTYQHGDFYAEKLELSNDRVALVHLAPVILENDFLGTVSIFRDITHEVEVDRLKSEFVATVSHELRTPMTAIKGYVDLLMMGATGALNESQSHFLEIVRSNINRLNILVDDLLDISRIESGRVTIDVAPVNLHTLADEIVREVLNRSQTDNKPMAISLDAPKDLPPVMGDSARLRQILDNLVDNAYNYTPRNGTIQIRIHQEDGCLQVDIKDNGVGIRPEDQARIFERFYRGEHPFVLATPGTGLGLPIVRELVEMHKGKIWMTSTGVPGEGSTFSFTLPIQK